MLPNELLHWIVLLVSRGDRLSLLRTCWRTLHITIHIIYNHVVIANDTARLFCGALASGTRTSGIYANQVRSLVFHSKTEADIALIFPMFTDALLRLPNLRTLSLNVSFLLVPPFIRLLTRRGIVWNKESLARTIARSVTNDGPGFCVASLPSLRCLRVERDIRLLSIGIHHMLDEITIMPVLDHHMLADVVDMLEGSCFVSSIKVLTVRFDRNVDLSRALWVLSETFQGIQKLGLEYHRANPIVSDWMLPVGYEAIV